LPYRDIEKQREYVRKSQHKRSLQRLEMLAVLKDQPCMDCGNKFPPECMDFDHLEGKYKNIAKLRSHAWETILREIEKCDLVCSNCHRIRTKKRSLGFSIAD
jgi:hypothetical protein